MAETKRYRVTVNGNPTVMKLTAKDAESYPDASLVDSAQEPEQADEVDFEVDPGAEANKPAESKAKAPETKPRTAANKARAAQNKSDGAGS